MESPRSVDFFAGKSKFMHILVSRQNVVISDPQVSNVYIQRLLAVLQVNFYLTSSVRV